MMGVSGAAFATCISYFGVFAYRIKDTQKYKQKIKDIVLWNWYQKNMVSTQRL